jgi:diguanylate cyclase (GGDEF)-like protein/PAS domain S-box-containing protein
MGSVRTLVMDQLAGQEIPASREQDNERICCTSPAPSQARVPLLLSQETGGLMFSLLRHAASNARRKSWPGRIALVLVASLCFTLSAHASPADALHRIPAGSATDSFVWLAYLSFAAVLATVFYHLRRTLPVGRLFTAFAIFFLASALRHYLVKQLPGQFSWLNLLLKFLAGAVALITAILLPASYRRLREVLECAARSEADQNRFAAAMETTLDAVMMHPAVRDDQGNIVDFRFGYLNLNAELMIGLTREALAGKLLSEVYPGIIQDRIDHYRQVVETGQPAVHEFETRRLFRSRYPSRDSSFVRSQIVKLDDGVLVTCIDNTAEREATQSLQRSLAFNKAIVDSSSFSIIIFGLDGIIASVNPAAETMLGYRREELIGRNIAILHDPLEVLDRSIHLSRELQQTIPPDTSVLSARATRNLPDDSEWTYLCRNGARLPVQLRINAVQEQDGATIALMASSYDLTDRKQTDQYIYHIAHHDALTGLPARALLREHIAAAIGVGLKTHTPFAVLMVDLNQFKRINDSLGHEIGDAVLRDVAHRVRTAIRKVDIVARFGGDEFVVLLNGLKSLTEAEALGRRIVDAVAAPIHVGDQQIHLTASIGLSMYPETTDLDDLLKHAEIALYHGKSAGRNGFEVYTPDLGERVLDKIKMESALLLAIERREFSLVYQPQISLSDHRLIGVEALIRWNSPDGGLVLPSIFIPVAEESGLIVQIGAWALETACREIAALQATLSTPVSVAVNLSPTQVHAPDFQTTVENALALSGLDPTCLELEITERLLMSDSEEALQIIERIQALGVATAIDDFGTGFSNMSYITRFKVDRLKIDRSFISRCLTDANSLAVTTAIIALAHSLNMEVIAEGVETIDQAVMLRDLECDSAQGYLYARPLTLEEVTVFARASNPLRFRREEAQGWPPPAVVAPRSEPRPGC